MRTQRENPPKEPRWVKRFMLHNATHNVHAAVAHAVVCERVRHRRQRRAQKWHNTVPAHKRVATNNTREFTDRMISNTRDGSARTRAMGAYAANSSLGAVMAKTSAKARVVQMVEAHRERDRTRMCLAETAFARDDGRFFTQHGAEVYEAMLHTSACGALRDDAAAFTLYATCDEDACAITLGALLQIPDAGFVVNLETRLVNAHAFFGDECCAHVFGELKRVDARSRAACLTAACMIVEARFGAGALDGSAVNVHEVMHSLVLREGHHFAPVVARTLFADMIATADDNARANAFVRTLPDDTARKIATQITHAAASGLVIKALVGMLAYGAGSEVSHCDEELAMRGYLRSFVDAMGT